MGSLATKPFLKVIDEGIAIDNLIDAFTMNALPYLMMAGIDLDKYTIQVIETAKELQGIKSKLYKDVTDDE